MHQLLPSTRSVFALVSHRPDEAAAVRARAALLAEIYRDVLPGGCAAAVAEVAPGVAAVTLGAGAPEASGPLQWGTVATPQGAPSGGQLRAALEDPRTAADWRGVWVAAGPREDGWRLVSGPTPAHSLKTAEGPRGAAVATRGLAALVLAGVRPSIRPERIAELVIFDYVLGEDELLDGTRVLEEAAVVDVTAAGVRARSWWPRAQRFAARDPEADPEELRRRVAADAACAGRLPDAWLGLTSGRDSILAAVGAKDAGCRLPAFTLGDDQMPDSRGAAVVARRLGMEHRTVGLRPEAGRQDFATLVRWSCWQEGIESPRTLFAGWLDWEARGVTWLSGHAGEVARAFYWAEAPPMRDLDHAVDLVASPARAMAPDAAAAVRERLLRDLEELRPLAESPEDAVDLQYLGRRLSKWMGRVLPYPQIDGLVPLVLSPPVVSAMLGVPVARRRQGAAFHDALGPQGRDLHGAAVAAAAVAAPPMPPRWRRALRRAAGRPFSTGDWPLLRQAMRGHHPESSLARRVLGHAWWADSLATARFHPCRQRHLWNALAVDALDHRLADLAPRLRRVGLQQG